MKPTVGCSFKGGPGTRDKFALIRSGPRPQFRLLSGRLPRPSTRDSIRRNSSFLVGGSRFQRFSGSRLVPKWKRLKNVFFSVAGKLFADTSTIYPSALEDHGAAAAADPPRRCEQERTTHEENRYVVRRRLLTAAVSNSPLDNNQTPCP